MADVRLDLKGEDGASQAFRSAAGSARDLGDAATSLEAKWNEAGKSTSASLTDVAAGFYMVTAAASKLKDAFGAMIQASLEQAKADRLLAAVAAENTEAFQAQAAALQASLGVSDDMVEGLQTMALRFGALPSTVEMVTKAVLDYSAATGEDATSAMRQLLQAAATGRQAFKDLGLEYDVTGDKTKDLVAISEALNEKLGGTAESEAGTLSGSASRLKAQFGELKEVMGGFLTLLAERTGVVDTLADKMSKLASNWGAVLDKLKDGDLSSLGKRFGKHAAANVAIPVFGSAIAEYFGWIGDEEAASAPDTSAVDRPRPQQATPFTIARGGTPGGVALHDAKAKAVSAASRSAGSSMDARWSSAMRAAGSDYNKPAIYDQVTAELEAQESIADIQEKTQRRIAEIQEKYARRREDRAEQTARAEQRAQEMAASAAARAWEQASLQAGVALVQTIGGALDKLAGGEQVSAKDILGGILGIGGGLLGLVIGGPAGAALGGAIGGQAGSLIGGAIDRGNAPATQGRRVRGGSAYATAGVVNVNVSTMDSYTMQETFERSGGRSLINALRDGRGAPRLLFGER